MNNTFFVTGTDTEVGKTVVSSALIRALQGLSQRSVGGFKPIAAGAALIDGALCNDDALALQAVSSVQVDYKLVNPIVFAEPIAPHIAAELNQQKIDEALLDQTLEKLSAQFDTLIVEGAGGWELPLNEARRLSQWVAKWQMPVILVVGVKLGCLNHSLLTLQAIERAGLRVAGWVANHCQPCTQAARQNVAYLKSQIKAPCLGELPYLHKHTPSHLSSYFDSALVAQVFRGC